MALKMIVMIKQVPDTQNITGEAMKPDGTVNRGALPAITNPEDLNALEEALKIKERVGGTVTAVSMGPPNSAKALKECLYRGVDDVILITDARFAGADTLATSYVLQCAVEKIGEYDIILCGRQAIDGDTAQVGPQLAEKLKLNQLTSIVGVEDVTDEAITVKRQIDGGYEIVKSRLPVLMTVTEQANEPRSPSAKRVLSYKNIDKKLGNDSYDEVYLNADQQGALTFIKEWNVEIIGARPEVCGLSGSPTMVKKIQNVVLTVSDMKQIPNTKAGINELVHELIAEHIIG
jgi:electron transfer flavoprotein beta subunit